MQAGLVIVSLFISMSNYDLLSKWRKALAEQKETTSVTIPLKPDTKPETSVYKDFISSIEKSAGLDPKEQEKKAKEQEKEDSNCKIKTACNCLDRSETSLEISEIQEILNKYFASVGESIKLDVSGECDLETQKAIMRFQKKTGIECDGCVGDETHGKMLDLKLTEKAVTIYAQPSLTTKEKEKDLTNTHPTSDVEYRSSASMSHVEEAKKEMKLFKNGKIKEWEEDAWPHIAKYWKHIGYTWAEKGLFNIV
jgi:murein L,D-transpeptidase YcbB/YkuD